MNIDLNIISHVALDDKVFYSEQTSRKVSSDLGGPISFATMIIPLINKKIVGITSFGKDFPKEHLQYLNSIENFQLKFFHSDETTKFLHEIYEEKRKLYLLSKAQKLDDFMQSQEGGKSCLLSPVFHEISESSIKWAIENHEIVGVDIQGFIRKIDSEKEISLSFDRKFISWLIQSVDIVKFSFNEAAKFTKKDSLKEIMSLLPQNNIQIVTMSEKGLAFSKNGRYFHMAAPVVKKKDPTGAGDVFMTYLLSEMDFQEDIEYLVAYGMALAAEKVKYQKIGALPAQKYEKITEEIMQTKKEIL
ncbi:MAG: hypothetical protein KAS63_04045 [Candidatus Heimdallarchaeota archaeon]|nr:hypothetical protein [Candidatus Heimdallarchaeota archaeon]MCK4954506.1 hypothetical protein [Candidatus Heimdallarchaeota archaeon]